MFIIILYIYDIYLLLYYIYYIFIYMYVYIKRFVCVCAKFSALPYTHRHTGLAVLNTLK